MRAGISASGPGMRRSSTQATAGPGARGRALLLTRAWAGETVWLGGNPRAATWSITACACGSRGMGHLLLFFFPLDGLDPLSNLPFLSLEHDSFCRGEIPLSPPLQRETLLSPLVKGAFLSLL